MARARVGCFLPTFGEGLGDGRTSILRAAQEAESLGFSHIWAADHISWNTGILSPIEVLSFAAAVTSKVRLGTGVYLLPLRHPVVAAKAFSSLDVLSGGRLIVGVGLGGEPPDDYEAVGLSPKNRGRRADEYLPLLQKLMAGSSLAAAGEYATFQNARIAPPAKQPTVPIWIGGRSEASLERAVRVGQGWFPIWVSPRRIAQAREWLSARGISEFAVGLNLFAVLADSREAAREVVARHMENAYRIPFEKFEPYVGYGPPDSVLEFVSSYVEAGVSDVVFNLIGPAPLEQLHWISEALAPKLTLSSEAGPGGQKERV